MGRKNANPKVYYNLKIKIILYDFQGNVEVHMLLSKIKLSFQVQGTHKQENKLNTALQHQ